MSETVSVSPTSDEALEHSLDELLGDAVVYDADQAPPAPEIIPVFESHEHEIVHHGAEPRVSPVFWAAAVIWNLPGGIGGWWLLRTTHPRTARRLLFVGIVSFLVIAAVLISATLIQRALNPTYIFIKR